MSSVLISSAIHARLSQDAELRGLLIAKLPEEADVSEEAILQRFANQVGQGELALPVVVWASDSELTTTARCGGFAEQRTRYRVEVIGVGDSLADYEPIRARIEELLAGWAHEDFTSVVTGNWSQRSAGESGPIVRLGNYYTIIE